MKNELIIASYKDLPANAPPSGLTELLQTLGLEELAGRFFCGRWSPRCQAADSGVIQYSPGHRCN